MTKTVHGMLREFSKDDIYVRTYVRTLFCSHVLAETHPPLRMVSGLYRATGRTPVLFPFERLRAAQALSHETRLLSHVLFLVLRRSRCLFSPRRPISKRPRRHRRVYPARLSPVRGRTTPANGIRPSPVPVHEKAGVDDKAGSWGRCMPKGCACLNGRDNFCGEKGGHLKKLQL